MKKSILILAFTIATLSVVSCNKNEKTEATNVITPWTINAGYT